MYENALKGLNLLYFDEQEPLTNDNINDNIDDNINDNISIHRFEFTGDGPENVLVNFLQEIVYLLQMENLMTKNVNIKKAAGNTIDAELVTIPCDLSDLKPEMEIKSVTYHNLHVKDNNGLKSAEIVFDV